MGEMLDSRSELLALQIALTDLQTPERSARETLHDFSSGRTFFGRQEHPRQSENDSGWSLALFITWLRREKSSERLLRLLAELIDHRNLVHAGYRAEGCARLHALVFALEILTRILLQRNARSAALLRAVVQAVFADVQVAAARAATPVVVAAEVTYSRSRNPPKPFLANDV
jgi:hypothetical protein